MVTFALSGRTVPAWIRTGAAGVEGITREETFDADYADILQKLRHLWNQDM
jgi:hypothetical protein